MADTKLGLTIYLLKPDRVAAFESDVKELICERCKKVGALAWDEMS